MSNLIHPQTEDITLQGVLMALAEPLRLLIVKKLLEEDGQLSCSQSVQCKKIAKSTISHHFRILREAGVIRTHKKGVENLNTVRVEDLESRFPGLLSAILAFAPTPESVMAAFQ